MGRGTWDVGRGMWDMGTLGLGDVGREDVRTRRWAGPQGRDKHSTPDFGTEFVKNFGSQV